MSDAKKHIDLQGLQRLNDELIETVQQQQKTIGQLREELELFRKKLFGRSSERHVEVDSQLHLFDIGAEQADEPAEEKELDEEPKKRRRRKKKSEKIPAHLKRKVIEADVSQEDRMCSCCGEEMPIIGTDISERVDLIPAELFVWEIHRHERACGTCKESVAQVPAGEEPGGLTTPVPGSDYGFGVYTQIIVNKFADHLPLYRGEDIFARAGMFIPRNTQSGMLANIAALISPLVALMKSRIVSGDVLGVDDTSVRLQDPSLPGKMRTARFWLYRGREDHPYNVFDFTESRGRDGPASFLKDFSGHAVVDAYGVHDGVYLSAQDQIFAACCNCHARRKFVEAKPNDPVAAAQAMAMYSMVSSAARHNLDVWAYVDDCLRQLAGGSTDYENLLPDVWRASHPESISVYRDAEKKSRRLTTQQRRIRRRETRVA